MPCGTPKCLVSACACGRPYVVLYRAGAGRGAPQRRFTIGAVGQITPEAARTRARTILGAVAHGKDPAAEKAGERAAATVSELADRFLAEHVEPKLKSKTAALYRDMLNRIGHAPKWPSFTAS